MLIVKSCRIKCGDASNYVYHNIIILRFYNDKSCHENVRIKIILQRFMVPFILVYCFLLVKIQHASLWKYNCFRTPY